MPRPSIITLACLLGGILVAASAQADKRSSVYVDNMPLVQGSGHVVSQSRLLGDFDAVQSKGAEDIEIVIGLHGGVTVDMDDNLQQMIRTEVHGHTLVIDNKGSWSAEHDPHLTITLPLLTALATEGSGNVVIKSFKGDDLALRVAGSGDIDGSGQVDHLNVVLDGSGDVRLGNLRAGQVRVRLNGSGDVSVDAERTLEAIIDGSGDIRYRGKAEVTSKVFGSGSVEKE
jgi:hypothetical protein